MSDFYYENQGKITYLVYELGDGETIDSISLGMLKNNNIDNVASVIFTQINERRILKFDVSAKITISNFLYGKVSRQNMLNILSGISKALLSSEEFMLSQDSFVLDNNYIYIDAVSKSVTLICLPVEGKALCNVDSCSYFKNLILKAQYDLKEDNNYLATVINSLNGTSPYSVKRFYDELDNLTSKTAARQVSSVDEKLFKKPISTDDIAKVSDALKPPTQVEKPHNEYPVKLEKHPEPKIDKDDAQNKEEKPMSMLYLLRNYSKENVEKYKAQKSGKSAVTEQSGSTSKKKPQTPAFDIPGHEQQIISAKEQEIGVSIPSGSGKNKISEKDISQVIISPKPTGVIQQNNDFGDTIFGDGSSENDTTTLFNGGNASRISPTLVRKRNNERIRIDSPIFRIGRDSSFNNYAVTDNHFVGHTHCHIISRNGEFFLVDDNSKNHTFLDGQQIPPSTEIKLSHGQKIRLSDEEFEFLLY